MATMLRKLLLLLLPAAAGADEIQYIVRIDGVTCPFCVATSERALAKIDGVTAVHSDLDAGLVFVCAEESADLSPAVLKSLFARRGFSYRSVRRSRGCEADPAAHPAPAGASHDDREIRDDDEERADE